MRNRYEKQSSKTKFYSMCICMEKLIDDVFGPSLDFNHGANKTHRIDRQQKKVNTKKHSSKYGFRQVQKEGIMGIVIPNLSQLYILRHEYATLIDSCTIMFGNECTRLVNIAFHTSQTFPSMMGTCNSISRYLQKELQKLHPKKRFHIIISENDGFSFTISDYGYFADIKQEQYRVLIFSTKQQRRIKYDTHDANSQMKLQWKSVVFKQTNH